MSSIARTASESSDTPQARRKSTKRITSPVDDDDSVTGPPLKRARLDGSDGESLGSPEVPRSSARPTASGSRSKTKQATKKKRSKMVISDPESEDFDPVDEESEAEMPVEDEDDDEYMSEPKSTGKRKGKVAKGGKGKKKPEPKEIVARDERKRPVQDSTEPTGAPAAKRPRTKAAQKSGAEVVVDVVGEASAATAGTSPPREDAASAPSRKKLPQIKKNKPQTGASAASVPAASGTGTSTPSVPPKPMPLAVEESKLPPPVVGAGTRKATLPISADVDLSNPMMYAQLFKSGGGNTPSGFTRREKDEERRKELNRMRDDARAKRINEAPPPFDLQGQMDKIARFEEKLRNSRSPAVYPNFIAGGLKSLQAGKKCYAGTDLEAREEGEM